MKDKEKSKKQLMEELAELRQRIVELQGEEVESSRGVEALFESEEKCRILMDLSPDPIVILQGEGYQFTNSAFTKVFGYTNQDVEHGLSFLELVQEHEKAAVLKQYQDRLAGKQLPKTYKIDLLAKDGRLIPCETSATVIDYQGSPADLVIIRDISERIRAEEELKRAHDELEQRVQERTRELLEANKLLEQEIEERKRAEDDLEESEGRFGMLVESMRDALGVQDENGIITYVNQRVCDLTGYGREELLGRPATDLLEEPDRSIYTKEFSKRRDGKSSTYELTWTGKDGPQKESNKA